MLRSRRTIVGSSIRFAGVPPEMTTGTQSTTGASLGGIRDFPSRRGSFRRRRRFASAGTTFATCVTAYYPRRQERCSPSSSTVPHPTVISTAPWAHPQVGELVAGAREVLNHAELFSLVMRGSMLLYNLIAAELSERGDLIDDYRDRLRSWSDHVAGTPRLSEWDLSRFWEIARVGNPRIRPGAVASPTRRPPSPGRSRRGRTCPPGSSPAITTASSHSPSCGASRSDASRSSRT